MPESEVGHDEDGFSASSHQTPPPDDRPLLSRYEVVIQLVILVVALVGVAIAICQSRIAAREASQNARAFALQRRPWLVADLAGVTVQLESVPGRPPGDTGRDSLIVSYFIRNVGGGAAVRCKVVAINLVPAPSLQLALLETESLVRPTFTLPPGDTATSTKRLPMEHVGPIGDSTVLYISIKALCIGAEVPDTFYMESVFFIRPYDARDIAAKNLKGVVGHEHSDFRRLVGRKVATD